MTSRLDEDYKPMSRLDEGYYEYQEMKRKKKLANLQDTRSSATRKRFDKGVNSTRFNKRPAINISRLDEGYKPTSRLDKGYTKTRRKLADLDLEI